MWRELIIGLVIVVLIVTIFYFGIKLYDALRRRRAQHLLQNNNGAFDTTAAQAAQELEALRNPTPDDELTLGEIYLFGMLIDGVAGNDIGRDMYMDYDVELIADNVQRHLHNALIGIIDGYDDDPYIVDRVEAHGNAIGVMFGNLPAQAREVSVASRLAAAEAAADTREEVVDRYFDESIRYHDDRQNVHDKSVCSDSRVILRRLTDTYSGQPSSEAIRSAEMYIAGADISDDKRERALRTLDLVRQGGYITTYGSNEDKIFAAVWERADNPANARQRDNIRESIINALADGVEGGSPVCINGRCTRLINSLVTLDYDPDVAGGSVTFEAHKNEMFRLAREAIQREIDAGKDSDNADLRAVAESYSDPDIETSPQAEEEFKRQMAEAVTGAVDKYSATTNLSPDDVEKIKMECLAAVV